MSGKRVIPRERLEFVVDLWLKGTAEAEIQRQAAEKYDVTRRQVRRYLVLAREKLAELPKPSPEAAFQRAETMFLETFGLARRQIKMVTWVDGTTKQSREHPAPDVATMAVITQRLAELYGVTSSKLNVRVDGLAGFLATGFEEDPPSAGPGAAAPAPEKT